MNEEAEPVMYLNYINKVSTFTREEFSVTKKIFGNLSEEMKIWTILFRSL